MNADADQCRESAIYCTHVETKTFSIIEMLPGIKNVIHNTIRFVDGLFPSRLFKPSRKPTFSLHNFFTRLAKTYSQTISSQPCEFRRQIWIKNVNLKFIQSQFK